MKSITRLSADYGQHAAAARRVVRAHFPYDVVLPSLLEA